MVSQRLDIPKLTDHEQEIVLAAVNVHYAAQVVQWVMANPFVEQLQLMEAVANYRDTLERLIALTRPPQPR